MLVPAGPAAGLVGGTWVAIQNTAKDTKKIYGFNAASSVTLTAPYEMTVPGCRQYAGLTTGPLVGGYWYVEKQGNLVAWISANPNKTAPPQQFMGAEGGWVVIPKSTGAWLNKPALPALSVQGMVAVTLNSGKVLVCGGTDNVATPTTAYNTAYIYDPSNQTWTATTNTMSVARCYHTATLLPNGNVLVVGGVNGAGLTNYLTSVDIYNPTTGLWSAASALPAVPLAEHTATVMSDGTVVVAGGRTTGGAAQNAYYLYTGSWLLPPRTLNQARYGHTATYFAGDYIVVAGGTDGTNSLFTTEIFNYALQLWTVGPSMSVGRAEHAAVTLSSNQAMFIGGYDKVSGNALASVDIFTFNAVSSTIAAAASMTTARRYPNAALLSDGSVFVTGGSNGAATVFYNTSEDYTTGSAVWTLAAASNHAHYGLGPPFAKTASGALVFADLDPTNISVTATEVFDPTVGVSSGNVGTFQVVKTLWDSTNSKYAFWVENPSAVEEATSVSTMTFYTYDSVMPGDVIQIGTQLLAPNQGFYTVSALATDINSFYVTTAVTTTSTVVLGSDYVLFNVLPAAPGRFFKNAIYIGPYALNTAYSVVQFADFINSGHISAQAGSVLYPLSKLSFPTTTAFGVDGYSYDTGLINQVNRIIYGDETDPTTYPGILAAGAELNISGPLVKRITISLQVRVTPGSDVTTAVQNAVAAVINQTPQGTPVAFSAIVTAAQNVEGVLTVTILSPTYGPGNDEINVQPYEKPLVLNSSTDITVDIIGLSTEG